MNNHEFRFQPLFLVSSLQFVRLIDGHLRILVAVKEQQRRISGSDMKDRARKLREIGHRIRFRAQEPFKRRDPHVDAVGSGLRQNRGQIRRTVITHDGLD